MIKILNYELTEKIYESARSVVYRGYQLDDQKPIIIKTQLEEYPTPSELSRFQHEYEISQQLRNNAGIITYRRLETYRHKLLLVSDDVGAVSLDTLISTNGFEVSIFLSLAEQLIVALAAMHKNQIMHRDLKPNNVVLFWQNEANDHYQMTLDNSNIDLVQLQLIDLGLAVPFNRQSQQVTGQLSGTLAYISPEQTGRINRPVDYRTDFYSLGVMLYELLTGQLPFDIQDIAGLVHSHIAHVPFPPTSIHDDIPPVLSDIIMKLLAKNPDERYQSCYGLLADIRRCQAELPNLTTLQFELAQDDVVEQFQIPATLYGRTENLAALQTSFQRVSGQTKTNPYGKVELALIKGYAGMGKTVLAEALRQTVIEQRGYFIVGRFNQLYQTTPYSAFTQAFNEFCLQILTEGQDSLQRWQSHISDAVGDNGSILTPIIPDLALIIDSSTSVSDLETAENSNRFKRAFQQFVRVISRPEHPLVLFLDNLHWADIASYDLLTLLLEDSANTHLLIIGAYRSERVRDEHPLLNVIASAEQGQDWAGAHIILNNLTPEQVNLLVADTLKISPDETAPLSNLLHQKTYGSPLFTTELLKTIYNEEVLTFTRLDDRVTETTSTSRDKRFQWQWDMTQVRQLEITDNVLTLMLYRLKRLSEETQEILNLAACIGVSFDLHLLEKVANKSTSDLFDLLWPAVEAELIEWVGEAEVTGTDATTMQFRFRHSRIQQGMYDLLAPARYGRKPISARLKPLLPS